MEELTFGESLAAVALPEIGEDLDNAVSSLSTFAAATESALSSALARCQQATGAWGCKIMLIVFEGPQTGQCQLDGLHVLTLHHFPGPAAQDKKVRQ